MASRDRFPVPRHRALALGVVAALALSACGSDDGDSGAADPPGAADATTTTTDTGDDTTDATTSTTTTTVLAAGGAAATTAPPTTAAPETTSTTTTTVEPEDEACLIGRWRLRSQEFVDELARAAAAADVTGTVEWTHVSGEYLIEFREDGTLLGERLAWTHRLATPEGALITTIDAEDPGTWAVDEDSLTISSDATTATVTLGVEVDGTVQPVPFGATQQVGVEPVSGSGPFECDGDVLVATATDLPDAPPDGITAIWDRI